MVSTALGRVVAPHELLFDAPPVAREVQFDVEIHFPKENRYRPLGEVSPVIRALATEQFDDYVKRVRIFAHPRMVADLRRLGTICRSCSTGRSSRRNEASRQNSLTDLPHNGPDGF